MSDEKIKPTLTPDIRWLVEGVSSGRLIVVERKEVERRSKTMQGYIDGGMYVMPDEAQRLVNAMRRWLKREWRDRIKTG